MTKEQQPENNETGPLLGKEIATKGFTPEGGWVYVDPNLNWEERTNLFPLGKNQLYKFGAPPTAKVEIPDAENENLKSTPAI